MKRHSADLGKSVGNVVSMPFVLVSENWTVCLVDIQSYEKECSPAKLVKGHQRSKIIWDMSCETKNGRSGLSMVSQF